MNLPAADSRRHRPTLTLWKDKTHDPGAKGTGGRVRKYATVDEWGYTSDYWAMLLTWVSWHQRDRDRDRLGPWPCRATVADSVFRGRMVIELELWSWSFRWFIDFGDHTALARFVLRRLLQRLERLSLSLCPSLSQTKRLLYVRRMRLCGGNFFEHFKKPAIIICF
jgi:hypothetical protein